MADEEVLMLCARNYRESQIEGLSQFSELAAQFQLHPEGIHNHVFGTTHGLASLAPLSIVRHKLHI